MENAVFAAQKKRVTEQLGEAVFAAVGLVVRQYMGAPIKEYEGQDSVAAAWDDSVEIGDESAAVNESFDPVRYRQLGGEMAGAATGAAAGAMVGAMTGAANGAEVGAVTGTMTGAAVGATTGAANGAMTGAANEAAVGAIAEVIAGTTVEATAGEEAEAVTGAAWERTLRGDGCAPAETVRKKPGLKEARAVEHYRLWKQTETDGDAAVPPDSAPRHDAAAPAVREEGDLLPSARAVSDEIERDARRYDSGFYLY